MTDHWFLALALVAIAVGLVGNIFALKSHETREFARADAKATREQENHDIVIREVRDMRELALRAIGQRIRLEGRMDDVEKRLAEHDERINRLETGRS